MFGTVLKIVLELVGALAMFLYGMELASNGIQRAAGDRLQRTVHLMTKNTLFAIITGTVVTIMIQSSSATTVMVVSFVNAGLLNLVQAIGVIMGANIGTTLTGWIIAAVGIQKFSIAALAVPIFGFGFFMAIIKRAGDSVKSYGEALMGFAMIFLGLEFLSKAIPDPSGEALIFLRDLANYGWLTMVICVLAGTIFTMVISASSATLAVVIGMASKGLISFEMAAALTLGANIGTTINSFLISLRSNTNAKRAAWAHIFFNIIGTVWVIILFKPFLALVQLITPGELQNTTIGIHIAMLHTLFNSVNTLALFPFVKQYAGFVSRLFKTKPGETSPSRLSYSAGTFASTPELNLVTARKEIGDLAAVAENMFNDFRVLISDAKIDSATIVAKATEAEEYADSMREGITAFLLNILGQNISEKTKESISVMIRITDELENATDGCFVLIRLIDRTITKKLTLDGEKIESLIPYGEILAKFLGFVKERINLRISEEELNEATALEESIDKMRKDLRRQARKRLKAGADVKAELLYIDIIRIIEQIGDYAFSISRALRGSA